MRVDGYKVESDKDHEKDIEITGFQQCKVEILVVNFRKV